MKPSILTLTTIVLLLTACEPVKSYQNVIQPTGQELSTHIGGVVMTLQKQKDLPNAFGNKSLFGRKVDQGATELKFDGLDKNGEAKFIVSDLNIYSDETTLNRTTRNTTVINADSYGNPDSPNYMITETSFGNRAPTRYSTAPTISTFTANWKKEPRLPFGEHEIKIISADQTSLRYMIQQ